MIAEDKRKGEPETEWITVTPRAMAVTPFVPGAVLFCRCADNILSPCSRPCLISSRDLPYLANQLCHSQNPVLNGVQFSRFVGLKIRVVPSNKCLQLYSEFQHG
jgi:hypothetical protein